MASNKFLGIKTVETKVDVVTRKETIKITQKDIDKLNQDIVNNISKNESEREKGIEIAERCVMK